jgi:hypothetical protein
MTRRQFFEYAFAYWISFALAKFLGRRPPQTEDFDDEVGLGEDGIVIRPLNKKRK